MGGCKIRYWNGFVRNRIGCILRLERGAVSDFIGV
jgi:hypothetical protein